MSQPRRPHPSHTPWGSPQEFEEIKPGIWRVSTAGHGGYWLNRSRQIALRKLFPEWEGFAGGPWYEEDCDWAVVVVSFADEWDDRYVHHAVQAISNHQRYFGQVYDWLYGLDGRSVRQRAMEFAESVADLWEAGSMCSGGPELPQGIWSVHFRRARDGKDGWMNVPYPTKEYYTTEELRRLEWQPEHNDDCECDNCRTVRAAVQANRELVGRA